MSSPVTDLAAILKSIRKPGDFATGGTASLALPSLHVEGVGRIAFPLLPEQAGRLAEVAERAPFGRGTETLVDTDVRRTWQFASDKVRIEGEGWRKLLAAIVERASAGLGVEGPVVADFYKLLLYRTGDFFVSHRDTEKVPGMFATLVVVPPSGSTGGELVVRHLGAEMRFDLASTDPAEVGFAAFYADCPHEVLEVISGDRLTLIYNLVKPGGGRRPTAPYHEVETDRLSTLLVGWTGEAWADWPDKIVYPLDHAYTAAEIGFATLKGVDATVAAVLAKAAGRSGCDLHLAQLLVEESGWAEHSGGWRDEDRFEAGDVDDRTARLTGWRRLDDSPMPWADIPVEEETELSPTGAARDLELDEEEFSEATGNEGASFERTYRRAALVLWPAGRRLAVLNQAGLKVTLPYLDGLITEPGAESAAQARELAGLMLASWPRGSWHVDGYSRPPRSNLFLAALTRFGDPELVAAFWEGVVPGAKFSRDDGSVLVDALRLLPDERAAQHLRAVVAAGTPLDLGALSALLRLLAIERPFVARPAARPLFDLLPADAADPRLRDEWGRPRNLSMDFLGDLLEVLLRLDEGLALRAAEIILAAPELYGLDKVLVPAVLRLWETAKELRRVPALAQFRDVCLVHLRQRTATAPQPPTDAAREAKLGCACPHCVEVAAFLADPHRTSFEIRAAESLRGHVESTLTAARADVSAQTVRQGRPYRLILTKTQASYEREAARFRRDLDRLARLEDGRS